MTVFIIDDFDLFLDVGALTLDPRPGNVTLYAQSVSANPGDNVSLSSFTIVDGINNVTLAQVASRNAWGSHGASDIDLQGRIYAQAPGVLTFTIQRIGRFFADTLLLDVLGTNPDTSIWTEVSGEIRVDRRSPLQFVGHWTNSDSGNGTVTVFSQETMVVQYFVSRTVFGFPDRGRKVRDLDWDTDGNAWVCISDLEFLTEIWKITPDGTATIWGDLSADFPGANSIMWVPDTNRLILSRHLEATGLWLWDIDTQSSQGGLPVALPGGVIDSKSFHNTKMTDSIWIANTYRDVSIPVPPGTTPDFPQFTKVNINTFTVEAVLQFPETVAYFPVRGMGLYWAPLNAVFSPDENAIFAEEDGGESIGKFIVGPPLLPEIRTTLLLAELVLRPHPAGGPILPPPPMVFTGKNLFALTGPGQPMEVCSGYIGKPPVHSQLFQVEAHYNKDLAPLSSELHVFHTEQIGETDIKSRPGVIWKENPWFNVRQTDRYHRACLFCVGDTEVTALTWMLREAGIR